MLSKSLSFVPLAIVITCILGVIYLAVQQNYRISANDPQIQIAQDVRNEILAGQSPLAFVPTHKIELSKSLATFIIVFDKDGKLIASSVLINGKIPELPKGVFSDVKNTKSMEKRFTWQPQAGVRSALVLEYYAGKTPGFIAVGRSLYEVEKRIDNLTFMVFVGWIFSLVATFLSINFAKKDK